jgi:protoporphyrinogen oxidase
LAAAGACKVDLYEKSERLGGLHSSPLVAGRHFDVGAFVFSAEDIPFEAFPGLIEHYVRFTPAFGAFSMPLRRTHIPYSTRVEKLSSTASVSGSKPSASTASGGRASSSTFHPRRQRPRRANSESGFLEPMSQPRRTKVAKR